MRKRDRAEAPTSWPTFLWQWSGRLLTPAYLVPALWYNIDWTATDYIADNAFAASMVFTSALCIEGSRWVSEWWLKPVCIAAGLVILSNNLQNATDNLSRTSDHRSSANRSAMVGAKSTAEQRSDWSRKVGAAREKVGDQLTSALLSDVEAWKKGNPQGWTKTDGCVEAKITISKPFCEEYIRLKGLYDVAVERDAAMAEIRAIDRADKDAKPPPLHMDAYASYIAVAFGIPETDKALVSIRARRELLRALAFEVVATFCPMIWLSIIDGIGRVRIPKPDRVPLWRMLGERMIERIPRPRARRSVPGDTPASAPPPTGKGKVTFTPEFLRWCADELEEGATYEIYPTPAYQMHCEWRAAHKMAPLSQWKFGRMMGAKFDKDEAHNYPRYLGVRSKRRLRAVS